MSIEQWVINPGEHRVIEVDAATAVKVSLIGGKVDCIAHNEPVTRIEITDVSGKDLKVSVADGAIDVDHPQLQWNNFLNVFKEFRGNAAAHISIFAPRAVLLKLVVVSGDALVSGFDGQAKFSTVSGELVIDNHSGAIECSSISGEISVGNHTGDIKAHAVSGDIVATGAITAFRADTVSGDIIVDSAVTPAAVDTNTVTGDLTLRHRSGSGARYAINTVSGAILINDVAVKGVFGRGYQHSEGVLSGTWLDFTAKSVSGAISVLAQAVSDTVRTATTPPVAPPPTTATASPTDSDRTDTNTEAAQ